MCSSFGPIRSTRVSVHAVNGLFESFVIEHTVFLVKLLKSLLGFTTLAQGILPPS